MAEKKYWAGIKTGPPEDSDILIMGIPFDGAVSGPCGAAQAPDHLRELSAGTSPFSEEGRDLRSLVIHDRGNVLLKDDWNDYYREVEEQASALLQTGRLPLFLGGDHSVTIPLGKAFAGHYHPHQVGMVHLDAHCDLMDSYKELHWSHACPQRRFLEQENVRPANLFLVGIREYEPEEIVFLKENRDINLVTARQYYLEGHKAIIDRMTTRMDRLKAVYLSIDIDILDPAYAPGTGTPQAGGLSTRELIELVRDTINLLPVKAIDLVEVAPPIDCANITSKAALKIIYEIFAALRPNKNQ